MNGLVVTASPHTRSGETTSGIMLDVIIALIPLTAAGAVLFGPRILITVAVAAAAAVISEYIFCKAVHKENSIKDLSAVVTGVLLALNLPPEIPLWIAALGSVIAIVVVKQLFGGLGQNFANPAITARIVLMVSFPSLMTSWSDPFSWHNSAAIDAVSSPTPLAGGEYTLRQLFFGLRGGCIGETCAVLIIICGIYLIVRKVISPIIPLSFVLTVGAATFFASLGGGFSSALSAAAAGMMSGGLLLGAFFMATDYVTSPTYKWGKLIFGIGCGLVTFIIRRFGSLPEGVSFSILLMNILTPHIDALTTPKPFGKKVAK